MSESFDKNEMANTNEVRTHWGLAVNLHRREKRLAEFDRWLAETIRQAKAEAWDEGYSSGVNDARIADSTPIDFGFGETYIEPCRANPYAEEADHE